MFTRDVAITPDGKEIYFCMAIGNYTYSTILCTREVDGKWLAPEIVPFSGGPGVMDFEPALSANECSFYSGIARKSTGDINNSGNNLALNITFGSQT